MYIFQVIAFIFEIIFGLFLGVFIALSHNLLFHNKDYDNNTYSNYNYYKKDIYHRKTDKPLGKVLWFIITMGITIYFLKPYFLDIPILIKGDFYYALGTVYEVKHEHKSLFQDVDIGGKKIKFFFSSGVKKRSRYELRYLPNTSRGIYGKILDNTKSSNDIALDSKELSDGTKISFPYKDILAVISIIGVLIILAILSPYLGFKFFILSSIIFYPVHLYLFVNCGLKYGIWFSKTNDTFVNLVICLVSLLILIFSYLVEKYKNGDTFLSMLLFQIYALLQIGMTIAICFNI